MDIALFTSAGMDYLFRYIHFLAGITWIGLLYYFNFVQTEYFKEAENSHKSGAIQKLVPRALWWFRWGAMFTFITGVLMLAYRGGNVSADISVGALLGTLMFMNVWMIIWPKQRIVIASATQVAEGGEADPNAAGALAKAGLASRTNTLFSMPMLFFMGSSMHMSSGLLTSASTVALALIVLIIAVLEGNGIMGKQGPMTSVKGVISCGLGLTVVLYGILAIL
jgi:uncharacterized membrane protein